MLRFERCMKECLCEEIWKHTLFKMLLMLANLVSEVFSHLSDNIIAFILCFPSS